MTEIGHRIVGHQLAIDLVAGRHFRGNQAQGVFLQRVGIGPEVDGDIFRLADAVRSAIGLADGVDRVFGAHPHHDWKTKDVDPCLDPTRVGDDHLHTVRFLLVNPRLALGRVTAQHRALDAVPVEQGRPTVA